MDAFSEILNGIKLNGALFFNAEFSAPWGFAAPPSWTLAPALAPGAPHLVIYHFVIDGRAAARTVEGQTLTLEPGDVVVLPHGDPHFFTSGAECAQTTQTDAVVQKVMTHDFAALRVGGGGETTRFVCGFMACDLHLSRPILGGLPPIFKVNIRTDLAGHWLENSILHLVDEAASERVGTQAMLAKLSEALFVDALRRYVATLSEKETGWLAGSRDSIVGKSLALMHKRLDYPWTIAGLAREVGISRSRLVERFTQYLSEPPMTYLTRWRLQFAAHRLSRTSRAVAEIAADVGYQSEAAFSRAFNRQFGVPPARYRREQKKPRDGVTERHS
ncbi:MAG: AraC family transcriptional regulator [Acidobacteriaceae bacterium]|nr:AraC family transcriptional regulator [Acidobacteriaceae bacterium]